MQALLRLIQSISRFSGETTAWLVVPLIFATVYDVVARYAFNAPTQWAYEVGYMVMGTHALLGMAYTLRKSGHIRIDAFARKFSERSKALIDMAGYAIVLPCLCWVTWSLWIYWIGAFRSDELSGQSAWNPVIWPFRLIFFVAFVLLILQIVAELIKAALYLTGRRAFYLDDAEAH
ncbi:MAG: TRAP transporter small permease subunit [Pseudolabrys sp.]|nr:TRAP transporter small permease subunit [Pseudolabrys sp.]MDP2297111.1 TRAP transporter small permease subunit [Pseudolabrys sp.]